MHSGKMWHIFCQKKKYNCLIVHGGEPNQGPADKRQRLVDTRMHVYRIIRRSLAIGAPSVPLETLFGKGNMGRETLLQVRRCWHLTSADVTIFPSRLRHYFSCNPSVLIL